MIFSGNVDNGTSGGDDYIWVMLQITIWIQEFVITT